MDLEPDLADEHQISSTDSRSRYLPGMARTDVEIGLTERCMVQDVGRVCTEVKGHALPDWEDLVDRCIHDMHAWSVDTVAVHVAERTGGWRCIGAGIEPAVNTFK